jgi:hypothetical protein
MQEAYAEIKSDDPDTSLSFYTFRMLVVEGDIPARRKSSRWMINMEDVDNYFAASQASSDEQ